MNRVIRRLHPKQHENEHCSEVTAVQSISVSARNVEYAGWLHWCNYIVIGIGYIVWQTMGVGCVNEAAVCGGGLDALIPDALCLAPCYVAGCDVLQLQCLLLAFVFDLGYEC